MTDVSLNNEIGSRIQKVRKASKLTQMVFAEKIGVSTQYISDLERGTVGASVQTIIKICDTLDISTDYILRGVDPSTNQPVDILLELEQYSPEQQKMILQGIELFKNTFSKQKK